MTRSTRRFAARSGFALVALLYGSLSPALAQDVEFRGFFVGATEKTEASRTFDAILGSDRLTLLGGGAEAVIARRWIVRVTFSQFKDTGTRVFVDTDDTVFPLDIPLEITVRPLDVSAGYRFYVKPRWAAYAAGGFSRYQLTERSNAETEKADGTGWHVLGGVEVKPRRWLLLAGESQWTATGHIFEGGAAEELGERELGGLRFAARIGLAF